MRRTATLLLCCVLMCSCAVLRDQSEWTHFTPTDPESPWNRVVDVSFRDTPLPNVIAELERLANDQPGPKISLGLGHLPSRPRSQQKVESKTISFVATSVTVQEAFRIIGDVADGYLAVFRGLDGVLARHVHGDGEISIFLTGRCVDATTGELIPKPSISREFQRLRTKKSGELMHSVSVWGTANFVRINGRSYRLDAKPKPQDVRFVVTAPGYAPHEFVLSLHDSILTYTNNIGVASKLLGVIMPP